MKRLTRDITVLIILVLSLCAFTACEVEKEKPSGQIVVGLDTDLTGGITPYWPCGGADLDVYNLTTGYETVSLTKAMTYTYNNVVLKSHEAEENADGSKTWTFKLNNSLLWSNGEKITARDYVFTILFWSSNEVAHNLGAEEACYGLYYDGYEDFHNGKSDYLKGVHLIDDYTFSVTVAAEKLPNYFEAYLVNITPTYMKGWVPSDIIIQNDPEKGCRFSENFKADYIKSTAQAYRYNQTAFSGPYCLAKYDSSSLTYTLEVNHRFLGNYEGQTPLIKTIIIKKIDRGTGLDEVRTGKIDLLPKAADEKTVKNGIDLCKGDKKLKACTYDRNGYGHITFVCNNGPTQFKEVRQAIAYLVDRSIFEGSPKQGQGTVINGDYSLPMPERDFNKEELAKLNSYTKSLDNAKRVLEEGGWKLDAGGKPYAGSGIRYKEVNNSEIGNSKNTVVTLPDGRKLMKLTINWAATENNTVSELLAGMLVDSPNPAAAGLEIRRTVMTFDEMLTKHYRNQDENYFNMYNLATDYSTPVYDVKDTYASGSPGNISHISDQKLAELAADMLKVSSENEKTYMTRWMEFQKRYNDLLPSLPLYSTTYADFFSSRISGYEGITSLWSWESQILYTRVSKK